MSGVCQGLREQIGLERRDIMTISMQEEVEKVDVDEPWGLDAVQV